jgi:Tol biopolymer transport system component
MRFRGAILLGVALLTTVVWAGKGNGGGGGGGGPGGGGGGGGGDTPPTDLEIVYVSEDQSEIRAMNADGGSQWSVVNAAPRGSPEWSPDGSKIVFSSLITKSRKDAFDSHGVYVVNVDGSGVTKLAETANGSTDPSWSPVTAPDGNEWILFEDAGAGNSTDLYAVQPDGSGLTQLTSSTDRWEGGEVTWSPDATKIALVVGHEDHVAVKFVSEVFIFTLGVVDGSLAIVAEENLTTATDSVLADLETINSLSWSRDGNSLVVAGAPDRDTPPNLWVVDVSDPSNGSAITASDAVGEAQAGWSPNDSDIVFELRDGTSASGIYVIDANGAGETRISDGRRPNWMR